MGLTKWPGWMQSFTSLVYLDLSDNSLNSLPEDAFTSVKDTLTELYLANVGFIEVPTAFSFLPNLDRLDLSGNTIVHINNRRGIEQLVQYPFANKMSTLYIKSMGLTVAPNLANLINLRTIDLSSNQISNIPACSFPRSVFIIFLNDNKLAEITDSSFINNTNLLALHLNYNPLQSIAPLAFMDTRVLNSLYLKNTSFTDFPSNLTSLTRLVYIDLTNAPLQCTCPHSPGLFHWFASYVGLILGTCTDVHDVGIHLNSSCQLKTNTVAKNNNN